jgi:hypothetical protein
MVIDKKIPLTRIIFSKKATKFRPIPQIFSVSEHLTQGSIRVESQVKKNLNLQIHLHKTFFLLPFLCLKSNIGLFEKDKLGFIKSRCAYSVHNIKNFPKFLYHQDLQICFVKRNLRYVKPCSKVNLRSLASIKCNCGRMLGRYKTTSKP